MNGFILFLFNFIGCFLLLWQVTCDVDHLKLLWIFFLFYYKFFSLMTNWLWWSFQVVFLFYWIFFTYDKLLVTLVVSSHFWISFYLFIVLVFNLILFHGFIHSFIFKYFIYTNLFHSTCMTDKLYKSSQIWLLCYILILLKSVFNIWKLQWKFR